MLISKSKFLKDNKIARARRVIVICSLWKIYWWLLHQSPGKIMLILINNVHEKTLQKVKANEFWKRAHAICYNFALVLQLCTSVTALHSSYIRMHSFSANQKLVIFSYRLLQSVKKLYNHQGELWLMNKLSQGMHLWSGRPVQYVHEKKMTMRITVAELYW